MIDENTLETKISKISILVENLETTSIMAKKVKEALISIKLKDGNLPKDQNTGIQITTEWRQTIYDDCVTQAEALLSHNFVTD